MTDDQHTSRPSLRFLVSPRWIGFHLVCLAGVVLMVNLSLWQWHRLGERRDFNERVESRRDEQVVLFASLVPADADDGTVDEVEWRPAQASGEYVDGATFLVVNRSQDGRPGSNVVSPLRLDDGRVLLVTRGFVPLGSAVPAPPSGRIDVAGLIRASEDRRFGQLTSSDTTQDDGMLEVQRLDIPALAEQLDLDLVPASLEAQVSRPADDDALSIVASPELSEGPHLSYAVQWLIFSTCVVVGWVFAVRRSIRTRARAAGNPPAAP